MKNFLAVFTGKPDTMVEWNKLPESERKTREKQGAEAWGKWTQTNAASLVFNGAPLGKTKRVGKDGISATKNELCAFVVVKAEHHETAAKLFVNHPHFTLFPGDSVEVLECLTIPGA